LSPSRHIALSINKAVHTVAKMFINR